jgi:SAM-dependent methyltransferase
MNPETVKRLCALNNTFYRNNSASFAETRQSPWPGWTRCLEVLKGAWANDRMNERRKLSVFDLACGNLRFEDFLASALPESALTFHAVDNCDSLVPQESDAEKYGTNVRSNRHVTYQSLDILDALQNGLNLNERLTAPLCDLAVSFGFLHHVPCGEYREKVLANLVRQTRPGGFVIVSLWQFLNDEALAKRAQVTHERALNELGLPALDSNDYLLGWQKLPGAYRYCHHFSEPEIDHLIESVAPKPASVCAASIPPSASAAASASAPTTAPTAASVSPSVSLHARFTSDGRTANLNTYLILKVS